MRDDVKRKLKEFKELKFGPFKDDIECAEKYIANDEVVLMATTGVSYVFDLKSGQKNKWPGAMIVTNKRIIYYTKYVKNNNIQFIQFHDLIKIEHFGNGLTVGRVEIYTQDKMYEIIVNSRKKVRMKMVEILNNIIIKTP